MTIRFHEVTTFCLFSVILGVSNCGCQQITTTDDVIKVIDKFLYDTFEDSEAFEHVVSNYPVKRQNEKIIIEHILFDKEFEYRIVDYIEEMKKYLIENVITHNQITIIYRVKYGIHESIQVLMAK